MTLVIVTYTDYAIPALLHVMLHCGTKVMSIQVRE